MVICLERGADDLHMIQLIGLTFLVPDYPYCRKQAVERVSFQTSTLFLSTVRKYTDD